MCCWSAPDRFRASTVACMADPILPGGYRAQVIFQGKSGLPEDRFITSWAFQGPEVEPNSVATSAIAAMLNDFYATPVAPSTATVVTNLSDVIQRGPGAMKINVYGLAQAPPRAPFEYEFDLPVVDTGTPYPAEVAVCASFYSERNLPRNRGRVYVGPLRSAVSQEETTTGRVRVSDAFMGVLRDSMQRLAADSATTGEGRPRWCVLSLADQALKPVTNGWVDDAFDIQRRRGEQATNRTLWQMPS